MLVGCLLLGVGLKERSGLVHGVGRYAPVRLRAWTLRDSGRVPLTPQKNAKDGELRTQLAALRQVSSVVQRSHPRAKRNQLPGSCAPARKLTAGRYWVLRRTRWRKLTAGVDRRYEE